jgi:HD-like signal output (HDOD) protein
MSAAIMHNQSSSVTMKELLAGNVLLASPPELFLKISQTLDDPTKNALDASRLIEHDPGLSARLLRIVNSAFYSFPSKIISITHAVSIIGSRELRDLVLATLVVEKFSSLSNGLMTMRQFWILSVRCALISRQLAARHKDGERSQGAFICGLLHEIGRLVVYHRVPELARSAVLRARSEGVAEHQAQREVLGFDHYQVGAELSRRWRLPEVIIATIEYHDRPEAAAAFSQDALLVVLAHKLSNLDYSDRSVLDSELPEHAPVWRQLSLDRAVLDEALPAAEATFQEIFQQIYRS